MLLLANLLLFLAARPTDTGEPAFIRNPEDRCKETVDPGPCQFYQTKWFWDEADESCKEFHYGGCMGNKNRFNTKHECLKQCRYKLFNPVAVPDLCLLEPDPGNCGDERLGQWWYYFNSDLGTCEKFFFYGCGGNDNKFYSLHMCNKVCGERLSPQIGAFRNLIVGIVDFGFPSTYHSHASTCDHCDLRISFCKSHSKFNYTCECRVGYEKNQYGDCVGRSSLDCQDCSPDATCEGGVCQCKEGFEGDGFNCTDVNECLRSPERCDKNAECLNREGSFICTCLPGFAGNGYNCTKTKNACLDKFDRGYQETCGGENWRQHYFLDHESKICHQFWYDGCKGRSRNIFSDLETCEQMCEATNVLTRAEVCWDKFDMNYRNQCLNGHWQQRFYFDHASLTCRQFWFDGCRSDSRNMFEDLLTCQWLCETQPMYKSRACLQDFDTHYKDQCNGGRWRQQYYFDKQVKRCIPFWYDGCTSESENLFQDEQSCLLTCENPAKKDPHKPWHAGDKHKMKELLEDLHKPNLTDICTVANPCKNNGTCVFVWKKNTHYCKCDKGYTGVNCDEKIDFDPCAAGPCKNGATCMAKVQKGKASYECYCAKGYGGPQCDQRPCDVNPCLHNGTCRTTAGFSSYFCDCLDGYGGKNCDLVIGSAPPEERYGSKVLLVSSGKEEWIQQMKERLGGKKVTTPPPVADAPYKSPKVKKLEREEREKEENERRHKEEAEMEEKKKEEELRVEAARIDEERRLNETLRRNISLSLRFIFSLVLSLAVALFL
ncbi:hypothetical protein Q1695_003866 [Nippostrongylus brasiliensis]|nr:hypothetical protein Q1695_003866 [Nippostrongylus brasiliensis]